MFEKPSLRVAAVALWLAFMAALAGCEVATNVGTVGDGQGYDTDTIGSATDVAQDGSQGDTATSGGAAWTLIETKDFDTLGAGSEGYAVVYEKGHVEMKWSVNQDAWAFLAQWSAPPAQIKSTDTISLSTSLETTQDVGKDYSANGEFNVWFDRVTTVEPGSVGAPVDDPSITTDSVHYDIHHGTPLAKVTQQMVLPAAALGNANVGDRVALVVSVYNGRSIGTRYTYEWK